VEKYRGGERLISIGVDVEPDWLAAFLQAEPQCGSELQNLLFKGEN
jgi:hypothetical protein